MTDYTAQMMSEDEFLEHHGVKGMKWGKRKADGSVKQVTDSGGGFGKTESGVSQLRNLTFGAAGNSKKRFSDPEALARRTASGKQLLGAIGVSVLGTSVGLLGSRSGNPAVQAGTQLINNGLQAGASVVGVVSLVNAVSATDMQKRADRANRT